MTKAKVKLTPKLTAPLPPLYTEYDSVAGVLYVYLNGQFEPGASPVDYSDELDGGQIIVDYTEAGKAVGVEFTVHEGDAVRDHTEIPRWNEITVVLRDVYKVTVKGWWWNMLVWERYMAGTV